MNVYYLLPLLLVALFVPSAYGADEHGKDFDKELVAVNPDGSLTYRHTIYSYDRINDNGSWKDYIFTEMDSTLEIKAAHSKVQLNKSSCAFSFFNGNDKLFTDSIISFNSIVDQYSWTAITQVNNAACEAYYDQGDNALVAKRYAAGVGFVEYKYMFGYGKWKTQLEATNLSSLTNRVFAFDQTIDINFDYIKWGGSTKNLDNFSGQTFDRTFLETNQAKVINFLNGKFFDFDQGFDYLSSVYVLDTGANKSKLVFHYMRNNEVLLPGETFVIDPTYAEDATRGSYIIDTNNSNTCQDTGGTYSNATNTAIYALVYATTDVNDCIRGWVKFDTSTIPVGAEFASGDIELITNTAFNVGDLLDTYLMDFDPITRSAIQQFDDIDDGTLLGSVANVAAPNPYTVTFDASDLTALEAKQADGYMAFGLRMNNEVQGVSSRGSVFDSPTGGTPPVLTIEYNVTPEPDAVDDLTSPSQSYGSVDLLWTQPLLNGGNLSGYQINYSTPWSNDPNTIITNNTASSDVSATVSSLSIATDYSFRVGVWTESKNMTGNVLNVTTAGNFTIGSATFNQTNSEVLPITFEEQAINSTATFLNVTYANTYVLACDFYYQFANDNRTYSGLTGYAVSTTLDETYFVITDFENEIINVDCYDTVTGTDANYLMTQTDFPLLQQIANFRNGTYGTMGQFGAFDFVTIAVVIFSMIGLNRVNESVGAVFNIILLGSLAWFGIIELPTILFGVLTVVIIFVITSTRKD